MKKRQDNRRNKAKAERRPEKRNTRPHDSRANKYEDNSAFEEGLQLEGRNPVLEALNHDKPIDKIIVKKGGIEGTLKVIVAKAREKGIIVQEVDKEKMALISKSNNNQGVVALCPAHEYCEIRDIIANARAKNEAIYYFV